MTDDRAFDVVLDEAVGLLADGLSPDAILARYPEHADRLRPLLAAAGLAQAALAGPVPHPNLDRGRRRFLGLARATARPAWMPAMRLAGVLASLVLVLAIAGLASANSLPGDVLYPVKRGWEQAQLALTRDPAGRTELEAQLAGRRRLEAQAVMTMRREAQVEFTGLVESVDHQTLLVSGVVVRVAAMLDVQPGDTIRVSGRTTAEGELIAERITRLDRPRPSPTASPRPTIAATQPARTQTRPASTTVPTRLAPSITPSRAGPRATPTRETGPTREAGSPTGQARPSEAIAATSTPEETPTPQRPDPSATPSARGRP